MRSRGMRCMAGFSSGLRGEEVAGTLHGRREGERPNRAPLSCRAVRLVRPCCQCRPHGTDYLHGLTDPGTVICGSSSWSLVSLLSMKEIRFDCLGLVPTQTPCVLKPASLSTPHPRKAPARSFLDLAQGVAHGGLERAIAVARRL